MAGSAEKSSVTVGDSDLPDIEDIVMEMGRTPGEPSAEAPSPLPAVANSRLPGHLERLADSARGYVEAASSANTRRAYAADWRHFASWCRRQGFSPLPPDPQTVGLYITACASGTADRRQEAELRLDDRAAAVVACPGTMPSAGCRSIARTAISPR